MATAKKNQPNATAAAKASPSVLSHEPEPGMRRVLQVISKRDGFRRAGREWHGTTFVPVEELTREQYEQVDREPLLVAQLMDMPEESVADATGDGEGTGT